MKDERRIFLPVEVCVNTSEIAELLLELDQIVERLHDIATSLQNHAITCKAPDR